MPRVKIDTVAADLERKAFEVQIEGRWYEFPFSVLDPAPTPESFVGVQIDSETGGEGFVYALSSGEEGGALAEHVLDYHGDPRCIYETFLHQLNVEAVIRFYEGGFTKRGLARQLGTSAAQIDRLLDTKNTRKTLESMVNFVSAMGGRVDVHFGGTP